MRLIEIAHFIGVVRSLVSYVLQLSIVRQIYMSRCFTSHAGLRLKLANLIELIQRFVCPRWARVRGNEAKRAAATQISPSLLDATTAMPPMDRPKRHSVSRRLIYRSLSNSTHAYSQTCSNHRTG